MYTVLIYYLEMLKNTSINQSIFLNSFGLLQTTDGITWKIDERGHWQSGNKFFNPFVGRQINYSIIENTFIWTLGNGAYLTKEQVV